MDPDDPKHGNDGIQGVDYDGEHANNQDLVADVVHGVLPHVDAEDAHPVPEKENKIEEKKKKEKQEEKKLSLVFNTIHRLCLVHSPLHVAHDVDAEADNAQVDQDEDPSKDVGHNLHGDTAELLSSTLGHLDTLTIVTSLEHTKWQTDLPKILERPISDNSTKVFLAIIVSDFFSPSRTIYPSS